MEQFPWTPGGKQLLETINRIIDNHGGAENMYFLVAHEAGQSQYLIEQSKIKRIFDFVLKYEMTYPDAAFLLGWTVDKFKHVFKDYRENLGEKGPFFEAKSAKNNNLSSIK